MFEIGSPVFATDGRVGTLQYVVLNPHTQEISDLVVKCHRFTGSRVISARYIERVDDDGAIHLSVDRDFVHRARTFDHKEFVAPVEDPVSAQLERSSLYWQDPYGVTSGELPQPITRIHIDRGLNEGDLFIGKGSRVYTALGEGVGTVDHVVVDEYARKLLYLVVRLPGIRRRRVIVAASQVKEWQHDAVVLDLDRDALFALPPFVPQKRDATLARLVHQAIAELGVEIEDLGIFVDKGHVLLRGHSRSQDDRRRIQAAAQSVSGVLGVTNEITTDTELELRAQQRLLADPVASLYPVDIVVKNRIATVIGKVPSQTVQEIILNIVRNTPGILSVLDEISINAQAFAGEPLPVQVAATVHKGMSESFAAAQEP